MNNFGSTDQETAIRHGIGPKEYSFEPLPPITPAPVPEIITGMRVDWQRNYDNNPSLRLALAKSPYDEGWRFIFEEVSPGLYVGLDDRGYGFAEWHFHSGKPQKQDGYGGRAFKLQMKDGSERTLIGPWHVSAPPGFVEIHYDVGNSHYFGLCITEALFEGCRQKFIPKITFGLEGRYGGKYLVPVSPRFGKPKSQLRYSRAEIDAEWNRNGTKRNLYPEME